MPLSQLSFTVLTQRPFIPHFSTNDSEQEALGYHHLHQLLLLFQTPHTQASPLSHHSNTQQQASPLSHHSATQQQAILLSHHSATQQLPTHPLAYLPHDPSLMQPIAAHVLAQRSLHGVPAGVFCQNVFLVLRSHTQFTPCDNMSFPIMPPTHTLHTLPHLQTRSSTS